MGLTMVLLAVIILEAIGLWLVWKAMVERAEEHRKAEELNSYFKDFDIDLEHKLRIANELANAKSRKERLKIYEREIKRIQTILENTQHRNGK